MNILLSRLLAGVVVMLLLACGGGSAEEADDEVAAQAGPLENGDPMPVAEDAGGVPPYPDAIVWKTSERLPSEFDVIEAFSPDSFLQVVEYYDAMLSGWRRTVAKDAVHYHRDPNVASVIVSPWDGTVIAAEGPNGALNSKRTSIGIAWRRDYEPAPEAGT